MATQTKLLNLTDFTGGLNLRANEFRLGDNESPDMLNVETGPEDGVRSRKGWDRWNSANITDPLDWDPRHAFIHEIASGQDYLLLANKGDDKIYTSSNGTFTELLYGAVSETSLATGHVADFAPWGDTVYIARGHTREAASWTGTGAATKLGAFTTYATFNDDYLAPAGTAIPEANLIASHAGRVWVAGTREPNSVDAMESHPNRVRWSHPNQPGDWATFDFIDILDGGGAITAIVPFEDHLLVFKPSSVWAIYGYTKESLQLVNVSRTVGALNRQVVAKSEDAVYFVSWPSGVHKIDRGRLSEISRALRPAFQSANWNSGANDNMWLGWLGQRLWWSVPYWEEGTATDARTSFVFDPSVGSDGAWTAFRSASDQALGPFAMGGHGQASYSLFGACRCGPNVVKVDQLEASSDNLAGTPMPFKSRYTTRWLHAGYPDLKKRWRRPVVIAKGSSVPYRLQVSVFHDLTETKVKRKFGVNIGSASEGVTYDSGALYDDGELYVDATTGQSQRVRMSSLGSTPSVQLQIDGEAGKAWGFDALILKYRPRRIT